MDNDEDEVDIELGNIVKDRLSDFEGVVTGVTFYLYSSMVMQVTSDTLDENGLPVSAWFDADRLELISNKAKE